MANRKIFEVMLEELNLLEATVLKNIQKWNKTAILVYLCLQYSEKPRICSPTEHLKTLNKILRTMHSK
jgi:hypothetical protein